jgi:hypothetical protein
MELGEEIGVEEVVPGIIVPNEWPEFAPSEPVPVPQKEPVPA